MSEPLICCETFGGDENDNAYRMLFGHHPSCPLLQPIPKLLTKKQFIEAFDGIYKHWSKYHQDKLNNANFAIKSLKLELEISDEIIEERNRLLELFPCPEHGQCVPYAISQIEKLKVENERLLNLVKRSVI